MIHAIVAADNLGIVNWTDQDRTRPTRLLLLLGWRFRSLLSACGERENEDSSHNDKSVLL
jgi:hypothetical protein